MSVKQIDSATGQVKISSDFWVSESTGSQDLINQFGPTLLDITKMGPGWSRIQLSPVEVDGVFFVFAFYFHHEQLRSISFVITDSLGLQQTWDDWSEEELQNKVKFDAWLTRQLGNKRTFSWGSVEAVYDVKGGGSSIVLRYLDASE